MNRTKYMLLFTLACTATALLGACTISSDPNSNSGSDSSSIYSTPTPIPFGSPDQNYIPTQASLREALELLEHAISAMSTVRSYHYLHLYPAKLQALEDDPEIRDPLAEYMGLEGDVVPPIVRFSGEGEVLLIGTDRYTRQSGSDMYILTFEGFNIYAHNGGLGNPVRFLSYARQAECGGIMGDEVVDGVSTVHVRFAVVRGDGSSPASYSGPSAAWDLWIEKGTYYVKQQQLLSIDDGVRALCQTGIYQPPDALNTRGLLIFSRFNEPVEPPILKPAPDKVIVSKSYPSSTPTAQPIPKSTQTPSILPTTSPTHTISTNPTKTPISDEEAKNLLRNARVKMETADSYHFNMAVSTTEMSNVIAEGEIQSPNKAHFQISSGTLASTGEELKLDIIQYAEDQYTKQPGGSSYELTPGGAESDTFYGLWGSLSPRMFNVASGFAEQVIFQGYETIDNVDTARILFAYDGSKLAAERVAKTGTPDPVAPTGPTPLLAEANIDLQTGQVLEFRFRALAILVDQPGYWSTVTIRYSRFNDPATLPIDRPHP